MSQLRSSFVRGICVAVAVPVLMVIAMPVRALVLDNAPAARAAVPPDAAVVKGNVLAFDSIPLPDITVTGYDESGKVIAMTTTGPNGEFTMDVPPGAGKVIVLPEGGTPVSANVEAGKISQVKSVVPAESIVGSKKPGWWSGLSTTSKAAILGVPAAAVASFGLAVADHDRSRTASPYAPHPE